MENLTVMIISFVSILMILAAGTLFISNLTKLPYTVLLVVIGFLVAHFSRIGPDILAPLANYKINPDIILYACLPTLIFESAFAMDSRLFQNNLLPVLTLAIPGLFLSTTIIGVIVWCFTSMDLLTCLLLGSILSATDPVAVIALFKQLGVPKRLTVLVEGESLLNDSTAIVTAKTILFVILAGTVTSHTIMHGAYEFIKEFFGGIGVGMAITFVIGYTLPLLRDEAVAELSLTVILAYLAFILADEVFHVSGVMAVITAGIMMGGWGRTKLSTKAYDYLHRLLDLLAYIANSLIFLLVGLSIHPEMMANTYVILGIVIVAMLVSRAVVIFGLIPIVGKLQSSQSIDLGYQTVMWWGGLRGAIALAIVFGYPNIPDQEILGSVVMGAVIFTILIQGLTIDKIISWLGLNVPPLSDQVAKAEAALAAEMLTLDRIGRLQKGGLFSLKIAESLRKKTEEEIDASRMRLSQLRESELSIDEERQILYLSCFAAEKHLYYEMFKKGHLSERSYRSLNYGVDLEMDQMRYHGDLTKQRKITFDKMVLPAFTHFLARLPLLRDFINRIKIGMIISDYERKWGLHQGGLIVLDHLEELAQLESIEDVVVREVRQQFGEWVTDTKKYLDNIADQFPEFVTDMQQRLGERILLLAKSETIHEQARRGLLPEGVASEIIKDYFDQIYALRQHHPEHLDLDPNELLRKIPFLADVPSDEVSEIIKLLKEHDFAAGENIIVEGDVGDTLYLIMRGVVRVIKKTDGKEIDLATLIAGDFFGEIALLFGVKRTATCKAVTPCILFSLDRKDFEKVKERFPAISRALEMEAAKRKSETGG